MGKRLVTFVSLVFFLGLFVFEINKLQWRAFELWGGVVSDAK